MYLNSSCWGNDSWWIIILFAIILLWICCGSNTQDTCCCNTPALDCGCKKCIEFPTNSAHFHENVKKGLVK